jgi:hypothetical protein
MLKRQLRPWLFSEMGRYSLLVAMMARSVYGMYKRERIYVVL